MGQEDEYFVWLQIVYETMIIRRTVQNVEIYVQQILFKYNLHVSNVITKKKITAIITIILLSHLQLQESVKYVVIILA
jgi:hypothetical protein